MIRNIHEARTCLKAFGLLKENGKPSRRVKQFTFRQRVILEELNHGFGAECGHVREAIGTDVFDSITANVAYNQLLDGYDGIPDDWRLVAKIRNAADYKALQSTAISGISDLPIVEKNGAYTFADQKDEHVTYAPQKRGRLLGISLEDNVNDAIGAFNEQASKLGQADKNTLNELVLGKSLDDNPAMDYDATALFDALHGNISGGGLSITSIKDALAKIMKQLGRGKERIYLRPTAVLVRPESAWDAIEVTDSKEAVGNAARSPTLNAVSRLGLQVSASPHLDGGVTDAILTTNVPVIEVAFVRGEQQPTIVREMENTGMHFSHDSIVWKIRHAYGAKPVDHRGVHRISIT